VTGTAPVRIGPHLGVRVTVVLYLIEFAVLLVLSLTVVRQGGAQGPSSAAGWSKRG
jgi:hypothetical protein